MLGRAAGRGSMGMAASLVAAAVACARGAEPPAPAPAPASKPADPIASSVSPAIARFMERAGQGIAPSATNAPLPSMPPLPATTPARPLIPAPAGAPAPAPAPPRPPDRRGPSYGGTTPPGLSPLFERVDLGRAPTESGDLRFPINLATALRLSDARPLVVAAAQAGVWHAEADLTQARVLWLPAINFAADYLRHDGGGPDFNKGIMTAPSVNFFYAGGGLWGFIQLDDALFEPLVARQVLNSRHWDVQTAKNDALMRTADAYFRVHQYRGVYAATLYCVGRGQELVEKLATMSRDLVQPFEVQRARNMVADLEQRSVLARQGWRVTSADLTQILRLDPRSIILPMEHDHLQITLVNPERPLEELMRIALTNRPELASRQAMVQAATAGIRREKMRPVIPNLILSGYQSPGGMLIQGGIFGLGPNNSMNQWVGRDDVSVQFTWQLEYFGFGNLARIKRQRAEQSQAMARFFRMQDTVAADVTRALARVQSAAERVVQADRSLRASIVNLNGTYEGVGQTKRFRDVLVLVNRPQEAVYALQFVRVSFEEYFATVAEYNRAQFDLFHALGYPAQELSLRHPPGEVEPVDMSRPRFLPPVGNGPPPATR